MYSCVVIPTYNEEGKIGEVVRRVSLSCDSTILVVDNNSTDNTAKEAKKYGAKVIFAEKKGKGSALRTGCDYAIAQGAEKLMVLDGDGQHCPSVLSIIQQSLEHNNIVFTFRQEKHRLPLRKRAGGKIIELTIRMLFGVAISDPLCGYRGFTKKAYEAIRWSSDNYDMEAEVIIRAAKKNIDYAQILVPTIEVKKAQGFNIGNGLLTLKQIGFWCLKGLNTSKLK